MGDPAQQDGAYADRAAAPSTQVVELIRGAIVVSPRPGAAHAVAASMLGAELAGPFHRGKGGPGGWVLLDTPELHLGRHMLVPDLCGWRRDRMPVVPDAAAFDLAPDWACEVLSPTSAALDRVEKLPIYAGAGVAHVWIVDPQARTLEVFRVENRQATLAQAFRDDMLASAAPFEAVAFELGALWRR